MRRILAILFVSSLLAVTGCSGGGSSSSTGTPATTISFGPATADVDAASSQVISGYLLDYTGKGLNVTLSGPGSIATTGPDFFSDYSIKYTAPGSVTAGSTATIVASAKSDSSKSATITLILHDSIGYPAQTPPDAFVGKAYSYAFQATGGTGALFFNLTSVSGALPPGLSLTSAGVLAGTPTAMGTYTIQVVVYDHATTPIGFARTYTIQVS